VSALRPGRLTALGIVSGRIRVEAPAGSDDGDPMRIKERQIGRERTGGLTPLPCVPSATSVSYSPDSGGAGKRE
jgi:hypothetical protein